MATAYGDRGAWVNHTNVSRTAGRGVTTGLNRSPATIRGSAIHGRDDPDRGRRRLRASTPTTPCRRGPCKGGVTCIQEIFGIDEHVRRDVDRWAELGFEAVAPSLVRPPRARLHRRARCGRACRRASPTPGRRRSTRRMGDIAACRDFLEERRQGVRRRLLLRRLARLAGGGQGGGPVRRVELLRQPGQGERRRWSSTAR